MKHLSEWDFLKILFKKSKNQVLVQLRKKDGSKASSFNVLSEVIFDNCSALLTEKPKRSCFNFFRSSPKADYVDCILGLVSKGHIHALFKLCEAKIDSLPDPKTNPKKFVDDLFELFFQFAQISSGEFSLNPNTDKKFMKANELTVHSTSSSSTPSDKYCADDSASDMSVGRKAKSIKPGNMRRSRRVPSQMNKMSNASTKKSKVLVLKPKSDDQSYMADAENSSVGTQKMDLETWSEVYTKMKDDLQEKQIKKDHLQPVMHVHQPVSILKQKSVSPVTRNPSPSKSTGRLPRIKSSLAPVRALSPQTLSQVGPPKELVLNWKMAPRSRPASLKTEQIKLVLARKQQLDHNRIKTIEHSRQIKEQRVTKAKVMRQSEVMQRRAEGLLTRQERAKLAHIKRQSLQEQRTKVFEMKGLRKTI